MGLFIHYSVSAQEQKCSNQQKKFHLINLDVEYNSSTSLMGDIMRHLFMLEENETLTFILEHTVITC